MVERSSMSQDEKKKKNGDDMKEVLDGLKAEIGKMQRQAFEKGLPVVIIFEGWDTYGMPEKVNRFIRAIDPRGYRLHFTNKPNEYEKDMPFIWPYFVRMPVKGSIAVFDRSWYFRLVDDYYDTEKRSEFEDRMNDARMLEEQHAAEGWVFVKLFLDLGKKELRRRVEKEEKKGVCNSDEVLEGDYADDYDDVQPIWKEVMQATSSQYAPWHIINDEDEDRVMEQVFRTVLDSVRPYLENRGVMPVCQKNGRKGKKSGLEGIDLNRSLDQKDYRKELEDLQDRLKGLQCILKEKERSVVLVFEGWDAAGKGGTIIRLTQELNPRGYRVAPIGAPNDWEKRHHYLWRFYKTMPRIGEMTIFDRSWYGRVLVERVEGFATSDQWCRAYSEINQMEKMMGKAGAITIKFWLEIDEATQLQRFQEREKDPDKQWKISEDDWRNRSRRADYLPAVEEMLERTDTEDAPWVIVPGNDKYYGRVAILKAVVERLEDELD
ncbi:MAG: Polyphosphate kinase 2 (PPK2) [Methanomassiliicoccales archaeon PtaU1.Bin124]|nr:MAG: Polyphosphate kinase 2 (PPK2) [Methanomassiliicoccales archaeon PtaU1.Bin124]